MRESLVNYLTLFPDIELCGSAGSAEEAVSEIGDAHPSLVLLDLSLPGRSGFELLKDVADRFAIPCLVLSGHREKGHVERAIASGARGYVLKGQPQELPVAIRKVMRGDRYFSAPILMFAGDTESGPH